MCITAPAFEAEKYITAFRIYITARSIHITTRKKTHHSFQNLHHSPQDLHHDSQENTSQLSESTSQPAGFTLRLARIYITARSIHIATRKNLHHSPRICRTGFLRFPLWSKELLVTKRTQFLLSTSVYHSQTTVWRTYGYVNTQV